MTMSKNENKEKMPWIYAVGKTILGPIFKAYYRPTIIGIENLPKEGNCIIAGDHIHLYDQCHAIISTKRPLVYMAKKEYFDNKKTAWFFKGVGCIPVNRAVKDEEAVESALNVLNNGGALGIFPEGTRNHAKDEKIKEIYDKYLMNMHYDEVRDALRDKNVKLSQVNFLLKLYDEERITKAEMNKAILHVDATLRLLRDAKKITDDEYYESLLLPFKFGTVSMAKKTNSPIIPMVTTGKYEHHSEDLIVQFGKPYVVGDKDLSVANEELRKIFIDLIKNSEHILKEKKINKELEEEMK